MIQLRILSGKTAGTAWVARRFPVRVGRARSDHCRFDEDGVWERHVQLAFNRTEGVVLSARPEAVAHVNGQPTREAVLRNGDVIDLGSVRLQFWLSDTRQVGLRLRELFTWTAVGAGVLSQIALVYWLLS